MYDERVDQLRTTVHSLVQSLDGHNDDPTRQFCATILKELHDIEQTLMQNSILQEQIVNDEDELQSIRHQVTEIKSTYAKTLSDIDVVSNNIRECEEKKKLFEEALQDKRVQASLLTEENQVLTGKIFTGPGWTTDLDNQRQSLLEQIKLQDVSLAENKARLSSLQAEIDQVNISISECSMRHDSAILDLDATVKEILILKEERLIEQHQKVFEENRKGDIELQLMQAKGLLAMNESKLQSLNEELNNEQLTAKKLEEDIEECTRVQHLLDEQCEKLMKEINSQKEANVAAELENEKISKLVEEQKVEIDTIHQNRIKIEGKLSAVKDRNAHLDAENIDLVSTHDMLKSKVDRFENVELKAARRHQDALQRQMDSLQRESNVLDLKFGLVEKKSDVLRDLLTAHESKLHTLRNELSQIHHATKNHQQTLNGLKEDYSKRCNNITLITVRYKKALDVSAEQDSTIKALEEKIQKTEAHLKEKQHLCADIKADCNRQSKLLRENHEELVKLNQERDMVNSQVKKLKLDISKAENTLIQDHFIHHTWDIEKKRLEKDISDIREKISQKDCIIDEQERDIKSLSKIIKDTESELSRFEKEYNAIMVERDIITGQLSRSTMELTAIKEKLKLQKAEISRSDNQNKELVEKIAVLTTCIQKLHQDKMALIAECNKQEETMAECHRLENELDQAKYKTKALQDELERPLNIHQWRILEIRDPSLYENILKMQKLQRQLLDSSDELSDIDKLISEKRKHLCELKADLDRLPAKDDLEKQIASYKEALKLRTDQLKTLQDETELSMREASKLKQTLESLKREERSLSSTWVKQELQRRVRKDSGNEVKLSTGS